MTDDERVAYLVGDEAQPITAAERAELDHVRSLLRDEAVWAEPDAALEQRVMGAIAAATSATSAPATSAPATSAPGAPTSRAMQRAQQRWRRRLPYALLGAAAAVLLAIGLGIGLTRHQGPATQFTAALTGTALAPSASGSATMTKTASGWRIEVQASGLPRRDNGEFYEAWLKNAAGDLVPIGTFNEGTDVTLWAGVPPGDFPTMTVTKQVVGAGPQSSKQVVLAGPVKPAP